MSGTASALPNFSHRQIVRVLTGILLCILLAAIDQTVVIPAVPAIAADLDGFGHLAWIVSAYLLTSTALTPIYGKLSDIYGRRALLLPAIVIFILASILCALSQSLWQLIAARALQGVGGAGLMSMAQAAIADVVAPRERGRYQGYMAGTWAVASIAGPILGGYLTDHLSWRWIFWINLPIGIAAFILSNRALRMLVVQRRQVRIDYLGAALLSAFVTACLLVMSWGGVSYAWTSPQVLATGAGAVALLVALALQELRAREPLLPPRLFTNPVVTAGVAIGFLTSAATLGGTFLLPLFFQLVRGADASASGSMLVPFLAGNVCGAYSSGQAARWLGRTKPILIPALVLATAGFALLAGYGAETPIAVVVVTMMGMGVGMGACMPSSLVMVQNAAERRDVGAATGALLLLRSMGGAFGSTLVGAVLGSRFASGLAAHGVERAIDLGEMRGRNAGLDGLEPQVAALAHAVLTGAFHLAFACCAAFGLIGLLVALVMRDLPLQSSAGNR